MEYGLWRVVLDSELGSFFEEPFALRKSFRFEWRAAIGVGMGDAHETVDAFDACGKAAYSGVSRAFAIEREGAHVLLDEREYFLKNFLLSGNAL